MCACVVCATCVCVCVSDITDRKLLNCEAIVWDYNPGRADPFFNPRLIPAAHVNKAIAG